MTKMLPVSELPTSWDTEASPQELDPLVWQFDLSPHIDQERILINTRRFGLIQKTIGLTSSRVTSYDGPLSDSGTSISSINEDGSAVKGMGSYFDPVEKGKGTVFALDDVTRQHTKFAHGYYGSNNALNKSEMASRVADVMRSGNGKKDTTVWAQEIDDSLRQSMRKAAFEHLMNRTDKRLKMRAILVLWPVLFRYMAYL